MRTGATVTQMGLDCHRNFSKLTARNGISGQIVFRQRLEHADREASRAIASIAGVAGGQLWMGMGDLL